MSWGYMPPQTGVRPVENYGVRRTDSEGETTRLALIILCPPKAQHPGAPLTGVGYTPAWQPSVNSPDGRRYDGLILGWGGLATQGEGQDSTPPQQNASEGNVERF
jgi:hypothetical protein